jgi:hypothetical protein
MRNISDKSCRENQNIHFMINNFFFENRAVYEIMWKNIVEVDRPQMKIWRIRFACWITEDTNTHSSYVLRMAFPHQQWLGERASILRLHIYWLFFFLFKGCHQIKPVCLFPTEYLFKTVLNTDSRITMISKENLRNAFSLQRNCASCPSEFYRLPSTRPLHRKATWNSHISYFGPYFLCV